MVGDPGDGCYRLEQGLLKVVITSPRGDTRILAVLGPGSIAGELALIDGRPRSASVFAIRDCELRFVGRNAFEECMAQHPEIYRYLVNVLAGRLRETNEAVAAANFLTVEARLARALLASSWMLPTDAAVKISARDWHPMGLLMKLRQVAEGEMSTRRSRCSLLFALPLALLLVGLTQGNADETSGTTPVITLQTANPHQLSVAFARRIPWVKFRYFLSVRMAVAPIASRTFNFCD